MIGQTIAHYRILAQLGEGGMGVVYKAEDTKLQRTVALKFLPESLRRASEARQQLMREAQAASRLTHPHIVTIYSVEESDSGDFIVMELVEGGTLRTTSRQLSFTDAIELMRQAAEGLGAAHEAGIIHRDIKPENLLIDRSGRIRISDFGLARIRQSGTDQALSRTIAGTPQYMSPEQATGEHVDQRSDIFSLGAVFYEAVAQRPAFQGDYDMAVLYAIVQSTPPSLSEFDADIPEPFERIIERCLAKSPADRYVDCRALSIDLSNLQRQLESSALAPARALAPRLAPAGGLKSTPLIGRRQELATIRELLTEAVAGNGHTLFVRGEPGIGKTSLAESVVALSREQGMAVLMGRCLPMGGGLPHHAIAAAIRNAVTRLDDRSVAPLIARALSLGIQLEPRMPVLRTFLNASGESPAILNPEQLWDSVLTLLKVLSAERPLVLLIEDLHWADADTVRLLSYFARSIRALPILQLATLRAPDSGPTSRDYPAGLDDGIRQLRIEENAVVMELARLSDDETRALASSLAPEVDRESPLFQGIIQKAAGNPLFVSELSKYLRLAPSGERQGMDSVPERVRDVIVQRLAGLTGPDREMLEFASCETDAFDSETLLSCLKLERIRLLRQLQALVSQNRVIRHDRGVYRFDHPLIREVLYDGILPELRVEYHRMLSDYCIEKHGDSVEQASRIAHHLTASDREAEAVPFLLTAAERARGLHANDEARRLYMTLEEIVDRGVFIGADIQVRYLTGLGDVMFAAGNTGDALEHYTNGLAIARRSDDAGAEVDLLRRMAAPQRVQGDFSSARRSAETAVQKADSINDTRRKVDCLNTLAAIFVPRAEYDKSLEIAQDALELAETIGHADSQSIALALIGAAHLHRGEYRFSITVLERAIILQSAMGDQKGLALSLNYAGLAYHRHAQFSKSLASHLESLRIKRALADLSAMPGGLNGLGDLYRDIGQLEEALRCHSESLEMSRRQANRGAECDNLRDLGADELLLGDTKLAKEFLTQALEKSMQYGYPWYETRARITLSDVYLTRADIASAEAESRRALALALSVSAKELIVESRWMLGRVLAQQHQYESAAIQLQEAIDVARSGELLLPLWQIQYDLSGVLAESRLIAESHAASQAAWVGLQSAAESLDEQALHGVFLQSSRAKALMEANNFAEPST